MANKKPVTNKTAGKKEIAVRGLESLQSRSAFSNKQLLVFIIIFAIVGVFVLWRTFAASPLVASSEFEQWQWAQGANSPQIYSDSTASGAKALTLPQSSEITKFVYLPSTATSLTITAKQTINCGLQSTQAPTFKLYIDSKSVGSKQITSTAWSGYSFNYTVAAAGNTANVHTMTIDVTDGGQFSFLATTPGAIGVSTDRSSVTQVKPPPSCINSAQLDVLNFFGPASTSPPPAISANCTPDAAWPASNQDIAAQLMGSINDYRTSLGLTGLASSPQLTASAEWKARQMAYSNPGSNFLHNDTSSPISRPWYQRIYDCGYDQRLCTTTCTPHLDENMSQGSQLTAQQAFNNWVNSPQNIANIESTAMAQTGIGVAVSQDGTVYIVQDFGTLVPDITQTISSSGSWVAPAGVHWVQAECRGAGGGGNSSGGGGGGAYAKRLWIPVTPGKSYQVNVGTGGGSGADGGSSSFVGDDGVSCTAAGGRSDGQGGSVTDSTGDPGMVFAGGRGGRTSIAGSGSTIATDNFNRADSNPVDGNWETKPGIYPMQIISGQLANTNDIQAADCNTVVPNGAFWKDTLPSNLDAEVTVAAPGSPHEPVLFYLTDTASASQVTLAIYPVNQTIFLSGVTDPVYGFPSFPVNVGDKIGLKISGTTVYAMRNGVAIYTRTLPSSASSWKLELASQIECFNPGGGLRLDDFSVTSLTTAGTGAGGGEGACSTQAGHDGSSSSGGSGCDGGGGGFGQQAAGAPGGGGAGGATTSTATPCPSCVQQFTVLGSGPQTIHNYFEGQGGICRGNVWAFKVDDTSGSINGILPGDPAWPAAVDGRNPQLVHYWGDNGGASIDVTFQGGDILGFRFEACEAPSPNHYVYSFQQANPQVAPWNGDFLHANPINSGQAWQLSWEDGGDTNYRDIVLDVYGVQGGVVGAPGGGTGGAAGSSGANGQVVITMATDPYLEQTPDGKLFYDEQAGDGFGLVPDTDTIGALELNGGAPTAVASAPAFVGDTSGGLYRTLSSSGTTACTNLLSGGFFPVTQILDYKLFEPVNFLGSNRVAQPSPKCIKYKKVKNFNYKILNSEQEQAHPPPDCSLQKVAITAVPVPTTERSLVNASGVVHCEGGRKIIMGVDVCLAEFWGRGIGWIRTANADCLDSGIINGQNFPFSIVLNAETSQKVRFWRIGVTGAASNLDGGETMIDLTTPDVPLEADLLSMFP